MKIKVIALMLALIIAILPMSGISAEKNKTKEALTTEQSLKLLKDNSWKSNEQLEKKQK